MLNAQEQKVVDLLGEAWSAYMNLIMQDQRDSNIGINIQDTRPLKIRIDDDTNDFRKVIHDGQRIVMTKSVLRESRPGPVIIPNVPPEDRENITGHKDGPSDLTKFYSLIEEHAPKDKMETWPDFVESEWFDTYGNRLEERDWEELLDNYLYEPEREMVKRELIKWGWIKIG